MQENVFFFYILDSILNLKTLKNNYADTYFKFSALGIFTWIFLKSFYFYFPVDYFEKMRYSYSN